MLAERQHGRVCASRADGDGLRFGFVVGKRLGDAVVRNRIKRRLREAARHLAPALLSGYDIVVIARGPIADRTSTELGTALAKILRRAGLLRPAAPAGTDGQPAAAPPGGTST